MRHEEFAYRAEGRLEEAADRLEGEARALGIHGGASKTAARAGELRIAALLVRGEAEAVSAAEAAPAGTKSDPAGAGLGRDAVPVTTTPNAGTLGLHGEVDVLFRLIRPDDVPALQRFHERLSEETIQLRFFGPLQELPEAKANYFAHVDGVDHLAFVALDPDDPKEIIALVRYDRGPGSERAEYAGLVEDHWQGRGVGVELTRRLVDEARDKGVRYFYAMVMGQNTRMLELLRHLDLPEREHVEDGVKHVEIELVSKAS